MKARELSALQATLRACPFCASQAKLAPMPGAREWWRVTCENYHCGGKTWAMQGHHEAVDAWNRRPEGGTQ